MIGFEAVLVSEVSDRRRRPEAARSAPGDPQRQPTARVDGLLVAPRDRRTPSGSACRAASMHPVSNSSSRSRLGDPPVLHGSSWRPELENFSTAHRPRGRPRAQRRSPQPVLHRGPPEPPGVPPTRCHIAPWSARLHPRTPAQRRSRLVGAIVRAFTFEDRQCRPRARQRVAGDLPEFGPAEFDRRGVIRHVVILLHRGRSLNEVRISRGRGCQRRSVPTVFSAERCGFHKTAGGAPV